MAKYDDLNETFNVEEEAPIVDFVFLVQFVCTYGDASAWA